MFARVAWLEFREKKAKQGFRVLRRKVIPGLKKRKGYRGILLLRDLTTGNTTMLTLWEEQVDMIVGPSEHYPTQIPELQELLAGSATREFYEVMDLSADSVPLDAEEPD